MAALLLYKIRKERHAPSLPFSFELCTFSLSPSRLLLHRDLVGFAADAQQVNALGGGIGESGIAGGIVQQLAGHGVELHALRAVECGLYALAVGQHRGVGFHDIQAGACAGFFTAVHGSDHALALLGTAPTS